MPAASRQLTTRQELFVAAYLGEAKGNATEAARIAGYAKPRQEGSRLLSNADIRARVSGYIADRFDIDADAVLQKLADIAFADWREFVEVLARDKEGRPVKTRMDLTNQVKALELLGKYHQLFTDKQVVDVNIREHFRAVPQSTLERITRPAERRADA